MEQQQPTLEEMITSPDFAPEQLGARFWYEQYLNQKAQYEQLAQKVLKLDEELMNHEINCVKISQVLKSNTR